MNPAETPKPAEPTVLSHADFLAAVSHEADIDLGTLTGRQEPEPKPADDLLRVARAAIAEHGDDGHGVEALAAELFLRDQYDLLYQDLHDAAVIGHLSSGELGFRGVDGEDYVLPSYEQVLACMSEKAELLETKAEQGFTKLLLVPIAKSRDELRGAYADALLNLHEAGKVNGAPFSLDATEQVWWWDDQYAEANDAMVYYPREFGPNHQGLTKAEVIADTARNGIAGWDILLIEYLADLPAAGAGEIIGGRLQLEAGQSPNYYLDAMQTDPTYMDEVGLTPEAWLTYAITHLAETNQVVDDYQGSGKISYLTGAYFPGSDSVPSAYWDRGDRRARLSASDPGDAAPHCGVRSAVRVS